MSEHSIFAWAIFVIMFTGPGILGYYFFSRHKEKMEVIKRGDYAFQANYMENARYGALSKGILLLSLSLGIGIGFVLTRDATESALLVGYLIPVLGCCGLGLLLYYFIVNAHMRKNA